MDVRRGLISKSGFRAVQYKGPEAAFRGRIQVQRAGTGGLIEFPDFKQFVALAREERISEATITKAFGHMARLRRNPGERPSAAPGAPPFYGQSRRVKLGHFDGKRPKPDIVRGQIVLYDGPSLLMHFALHELTEGKNAGKLVTMEGRNISLASGLNQARKRGIPMPALLQAFGHMLDPATRRELARAAHQ